MKPTIIKSRFTSKWTTYFVLIACILAIALIGACQKTEGGYISDYMSYSPKTLEVRQGIVGFSKSITLDGSTPPITVKLLDVRDKRTGKSTNLLQEEHEISVFTGVITADDVTMEQLAEKIETSAMPSLILNEIGGRVGMTRATLHVDTGVFTIDVQVSNNVGTQVIKDALQIAILPTTSSDVLSHSVTLSDLGSETNFVQTGNYEFDVRHFPNDEDKIVLKWVDKNGRPFNPSAGEVIKRGDRPTLAAWLPYYPEELTDTAIVYRYPRFSGLSYPLYNQTTIGGTSWTNGVMYYRVAGSATDIGKNLNPVASLRFNLPGTHIVTFKLNDVSNVN